MEPGVRSSFLVFGVCFTLRLIPLQPKGRMPYIASTAAESITG